MSWIDLLFSAISVVCFVAIIALLSHVDRSDDEELDMLLRERREWHMEDEEQDDDDLEQLRDENEQLRQENAQLRKWMPYSKGVLLTWGDN